MKKNLRQSQRRRARNLIRKRAMKDAVKAFEKAVGEGDAEQTAAAFSHAQKCIDKAVRDGIIKTNTAARRKARLAGMAAAQSS